MPDPGTYGMPESMWDRGWALRRGHAWVASKAQAPTALLPAVWSIRNNDSATIIEEIRISSDTAMMLSIVQTNGDPLLAAFTAFNRFNFGSTNTPACEAAVAAVPVFVDALFTAVVQPGIDALLLNGAWLMSTLTAGVMIYTPAVAAIVTVTCFGWDF